MPDTRPQFEAASSLQAYQVDEKEYLRRNPQYHFLACGAVVFNAEGKMLLVQRAAEEHAFPNVWEVPGGKVDDTDETLLHAVARELKEETGLDATKIVRKVGEFGWSDTSKRTGKETVWRKLIFEVEVKDLTKVTLDPIEHQKYLWATEEEVINDKVGDVALSWITPPNKEANVEAFKSRGQVPPS